jgi:hypothetical protein
MLSRLGNIEWVLLIAEFQYEVDADGNGVADPQPWKSLNNSRMNMLVHRSVLERGEKILFNTRATLLSETLLARAGRIISKEALDQMGRESGAVDYNDVMSTKRPYASNLSQITPGFVGYMSSVYSGDSVKRATSLKNVAKMENHLILDIVENPSNHDPMLRIQSMSGGTIFYTLD